MKEAAAANIAGGTIYDALLARCAMKAGAEVIYTWNVRHFQQFSAEISERVRTP
jgi:predicted nucleic acid-binding protein